MREKLVKKFEEVYGKGGEIFVFFAPGRVNLIGEHTDYNGGHVFPCTLDMGTYMVVRARDDKKIYFYSENIEKCKTTVVSLDSPNYTATGEWIDYPVGVLWALAKKGYKTEIGMEIFISGNIPNGAGLSSSASLELCMGLAIKKMCNFADLSMTQLALICQYAENNYNGCNCGIMDQFTIAMGKRNTCLFLDTNTLNYKYIPIDLPEHKIVITNSKVKHSLVDSTYNQRRKECEMALEELKTVVNIQSLGELDEKTFEIHKNAIKSPIRQKRAHHAVYENQRTIKAVNALEKNNIKKFGSLMNASHISLRDDYEVSCKEIDLLVNLAWQTDGVLGSRITGGGFGGCTVSIIHNDKIAEYKEKIYNTYKAKTGRLAEFYIVNIGDGAKEL